MQQHKPLKIQLTIGNRQSKYLKVCIVNLIKLSFSQKLDFVLVKANSNVREMSFLQNFYREDKLWLMKDFYQHFRINHGLKGFSGGIGQVITDTVENKISV